CPLGNVRCQAAQDREAAEGEAGVVQVRAALAAGETAVGILSAAQVCGLSLAKLLRQPGQAVAQPGGQPLKIVLAFHEAEQRLLQRGLELLSNAGGDLN